MGFAKEKNGFGRRLLLPGFESDLSPRMPLSWGNKIFTLDLDQPKTLKPTVAGKSEYVFFRLSEWSE